MNYKYYLNEPYITEKEREYVLDVLESRWLSIKGKHVRVFEEKFAKMVGLKYALAVQSGTAALHTALLSLGVSKGDKVVAPNFTCAADITTIIQCGAIPVILDVEEDTFGLDGNILEEYIKAEKPKAVILVHVYGFAARDIEKIARICKRENIFLIEDCCESHGAEYNGKKLGCFGDIAVFSIRSEKMIGVGEGGLVVTDDYELMDKASYWAGRAAPYRGSEHPYWYKYYYTGVGMNYMMPHLLGAVGRAQIENFDEILSRKRKVGERYYSILKDIQIIKLQKKIEKSSPSYWLNIVLLQNKTVEEVRSIGNKLMELGVEIRPGFWPIGNQRFFREYAWGSQRVGTMLFEKGIVLPSSVFLADNDCKGVKEITEILLSLIRGS